MLTILAGRFECVQPLHVGIYFEAYRATDKALDRSVFVKIARASGDAVAAKIVDAHVALWRRLAREKFQGSPTILDCGRDGGLTYLITEWIGSPSLRTLLDHDRRPIADPDEFLRVLFTRSLSALAEFHARGFVHGDISPGNILADPSAKFPVVYLVDPAPQFDLPDPSDPTRRLILGNPHFCAPEVLSGEAVSARADLFALGTVIEEAARILGAVAPGPASRLTAARPEDRPASAEEALALLQDKRPQAVEISPTAGPASTDAWTAVSAAVSVPIPQKVTEAWNAPTVLAPVGMPSARSEEATAPTNAVSVPAVPTATEAPTIVLSVPASPAAASTAPTVALSVPSRLLADFSVVAPKLIELGRNFVVEVWVAPSGRSAEMLAEATRSGRMIERGNRSHINLERDTVITVLLKLPDFEVPDPMEMLGWDSDIRNVSFIVKAPASLAPGVYPGIAKLMKGQLPFASIAFDLAVTSSTAKVEALPEPLKARVQRIARAFASYASQDRAEVLRRVQGIQATGMDVFLDVVNLRSGQDWERAIYHEIDTCDGFFLFWSHNAAQSSWVEHEWRYALKQHGLEFISPLALEDPRLTQPPAELKSMHFNDMLLAFIHSEDAIAKRASSTPPS
jgi:TIR domain/Protein kinase domain